jgi:hypothetical protein
LTLTIPRSLWIRGTDSPLLAKDGKRSAVGFLLHAHGIPDTELLGRYSAHEVPGIDQRPGLGWLVYAGRSSEDADSCYVINDDPWTTDVEKLRGLQVYFGLQGVRLVVED